MKNLKENKKTLRSSLKINGREAQQLPLLTKKCNRLSVGTEIVTLTRPWFIIKFLKNVSPDITLTDLQFKRLNLIKQIIKLFFFLYLSVGLSCNCAHHLWSDYSITCCVYMLHFISYPFYLFCASIIIFSLDLCWQLSLSSNWCCTALVTESPTLRLWRHWYHRHYHHQLYPLKKKEELEASKLIHWEQCCFWRNACSVFVFLLI